MSETKKLPIEIPKEEIEQFCQRHHIRKLSLFGSVLRDDFIPGSDVDFLVEFEPGKLRVSLRLSVWKWNFQNCWRGER